MNKGKPLDGVPPCGAAAPKRLPLGTRGALIVDKPSVCQRICPTACKSDDLRPAVGTGMHFYRKRKRLLCKKCQK